MNFEQSLTVGKTGESLIARYMLSRGHSVLPIYEVLPGNYKGPALYTATRGQLVAPDMLILGKDGKITWIEAKHKSAFAWYRKTQEWHTGIDCHHFEQYLQIQDLHPNIPIWLLFLHQNGRAKDTPEGMISPTGLFGNSLTYLRDNVHQTDTRWGKHGMVYWGLTALRLLAPLEQLTPRG